MTESKAYLDTTVLTDALLKQGIQGEAARSALKKYSETILPVYAIKEFKAGALNYYIWLHNKLALTKSLASTLEAIAVIAGFQVNRAKTSLQALSSVLRPLGSPVAMNDHELADLYRCAVARLILSSWEKRRTITSVVTNELPCYSEDDPKIEMRLGLFTNPGMLCKLYGDEECCLGKSLKANPQQLDSLLEAIKGLTRREDTKRRAVLHKLSNTPKRIMNAKDCRDLGDAYFALSAPPDAVILTTNLKDHQSLATSLGKAAVAP